MTSPRKDLAPRLAAAAPAARAILERALDDREIEPHDALALLGAAGADLDALVATADELRHRQAGDHVTYVVNRNVNFTNVCVKACKFCAFSRTHRSEQGYYLGPEEVIRRAQEAWELGATEICIQAGLPPGAKGSLYVDLCRAVKKALPDIHVHAFSPEEIKYGAGLSGCSIAEYVRALKDAGLGSIPGTSAEILVDPVRKRLAGGRITTSEWIEVIRSAHEASVPTTCTVMFGHIDAPGDLVTHLDVLRTIQRETHGFTEFVPLSFIFAEAPLYMKSMVPEVRPGPSPEDVMRLFAVSRLFLGRCLPNLQASWVKEGPERAQQLLLSGANDLGGTLINESISTSAGAGHGQRLRPGELRRLIREIGRTPVQRDTLYRPLRQFGRTLEPGEAGPLDLMTREEEARLGSYDELTRDTRFRFHPPGDPPEREASPEATT